MGLFSKKEETFSVLPESVGIIMDGNGRWAKMRGLPRSAGHKKGAKTFKEIAEICADLGIKYVTFYAFSCENWKRPKEEVDAIMRLFKEYLIEVNERNKERDNVVIRFIGERDGIERELLDLMETTEELGKGRQGTVVNIAINYGGRQELVSAVKKLVQMVEFQEKRVEDISQEDISNSIYTSGQKDPDLIIRPSGEQRLSNFMLWQSAYSEFWYSDVLWPDFSKKDLYKAFRAYEKRNRRFGG